MLKRVDSALAVYSEVQDLVNALDLYTVAVEHDQIAIDLIAKDTNRYNKRHLG